MNNAIPKPQMPRIANLPPARPIPPEYDPEVLAVAHRQLEAVRTIASLQEERDHWQRQCLSAQTEIARLEKRIAQDATEAETRFDKITHDLDFWKAEAVRIEAILQAGSRVFLQALEHKRAGHPIDDAGKAGLAAIADALGDEPLPRVVAAGPLNPDDEGK